MSATLSLWRFLIVVAVLIVCTSIMSCYEPIGEVAEFTNVTGHLSIVSDRDVQPSLAGVKVLAILDDPVKRDTVRGYGSNDTLTNADGYFIIQLPQGTYTLYFSRPDLSTERVQGFQSVPPGEYAFTSPIKMHK